MPSYEHICTNIECAFEWEEEYSIKEDPPKICPQCKQETAKRLISGGSGRGIVELYGQELKDKLRADGQALKRKVKTSEKLLANVVGEAKYEQNVKRFGG